VRRPHRVEHRQGRDPLGRAAELSASKTACNGSFSAACKAFCVRPGLTPGVFREQQREQQKAIIGEESRGRMTK
jgi:hypothetical protein